MEQNKNTIRVKRIYETASEEDGYRILVDRLWPRGMSKEKAYIEEWAKDISPSKKIRKEFHHDPTRIEEFRMKYQMELDNNEKSEEYVKCIQQKLANHNVTLLFASKNEDMNHAIILKSWLEQHIDE